MTAAQIKKLHTLLGKTEALQGEVGNDRIAERLNAAKEQLFRALALAECE